MSTVRHKLVGEKIPSNSKQSGLFPLMPAAFTDRNNTQTLFDCMVQELQSETICLTDWITFA